jgi:hypothetical protein
MSTNKKATARVTEKWVAPSKGGYSAVSTKDNGTSRPTPPSNLPASGTVARGTKRPVG